MGVRGTAAGQSSNPPPHGLSQLIDLNAHTPILLPVTSLAPQGRDTVAAPLLTVNLRQ
jgi:hypothetical protein